MDANYQALALASQVLKRPLHVEMISWKPGVMTGAAKNWKPGNEVTKEMKTLAMAYGDFRAYMNALDTVCGPFWSHQYEPWGDKRLTCVLTIFGVTRSSTGEFAEGQRGDAPEGTAAEAQAFKRACAMFGLGRYLYMLPSKWIALAEAGRGLAISDAGRTELNSWYSRMTSTWDTKYGARVTEAEVALAKIMDSMLTGKSYVGIEVPQMPSVPEVGHGEPDGPEPMPETQPQTQQPVQPQVASVEGNPFDAPQAKQPVRPAPARPAPAAASAKATDGSGAIWESWTGVSDAKAWAKQIVADEATIATMWIAAFQKHGKMNASNRNEVFADFVDEVNKNKGV